MFSHIDTTSCLLALTITKQQIKCHTQGHNTVTLVSLELATLRTKIENLILDSSSNIVFRKQKNTKSPLKEVKMFASQYYETV